MMLRSIAVFALLAGSMGCAHAPASGAPSMSAPDVHAPTPAPQVDEPEPEPVAALEVPAGATVLVMEAEDLGGGADMIMAPPKRPKLGSMMSDIGMAPSR